MLISQRTLVTLFTVLALLVSGFVSSSPAMGMSSLQHNNADNVSHCGSTIESTMAVDAEMIHSQHTDASSCPLESHGVHTCCQSTCSNVAMLSILSLVGAENLHPTILNASYSSHILSGHANSLDRPPRTILS